MFDVTKLVVKETTMPKIRRGAGKDQGPNPFLDKTWPFNLENSYKAGKAFEITLPGHIEKGVIKSGDREGQTVERVRGDAAVAQTLLRDASNKLDLGVSITVDTVDAEGKKVPEGHLVVKYKGQKRRVAKEATATPPTSPPVTAPATAPAVVAPSAPSVPAAVPSAARKGPSGK